MECLPLPPTDPHLPMFQRCRLQRPGIQPAQPEPERHRSVAAAHRGEATHRGVFPGPGSEQVCGNSARRLPESTAADRADPRTEPSEFRSPESIRRTQRNAQLAISAQQQDRGVPHRSYQTTATAQSEYEIKRSLTMR